MGRLRESKGLVDLISTGIVLLMATLGGHNTKFGRSHNFSSYPPGVVKRRLRLSESKSLELKYKQLFLPELRHVYEQGESHVPPRVSTYHLHSLRNNFDLEILPHPICSMKLSIYACMMPL